MTSLLLPAPGSLYRQASKEWPEIYRVREAILGASCSIVPFGDRLIAGKESASTFLGKRFATGGLAPTWTPTEALSALDTPFDLSLPSNWLGAAPLLKLNTTTVDEAMSTPDAAYWTAALTAFSAGCWARWHTIGTSQALWGKWADTTGVETREWRLHVNGVTGIQFNIFDETADARIARYQNAVSFVNGAIYHIVGTYDGGTAASGIKIYVNGAQVDDTNDNTGVFVTMQDTAATVRIGSRTAAGGTQTDFLKAHLLGGPFGPFYTPKELTSFEVANLYHYEREKLGIN